MEGKYREKLDFNHEVIKQKISEVH